jgi:hypothetical protein
MCLPPSAAGTPEPIYQTLKPYYDPNQNFPKSYYEGSNIFPDSWTNLQTSNLKKTLRTSKYFSIFMAIQI